MVKMLEALGLRWEEFSASDESNCLKLKTMAWLTGETDASRWYRPDELLRGVQQEPLRLPGQVP